MKSCRLRTANVSVKEFQPAFHTCFSYKPFTPCKTLFSNYIITASMFISIR